MNKSNNPISYHQVKIALDTLKLSASGAFILGGPGHKEAVEILRSAGYTDWCIHKRLVDAGHDPEYVGVLLKEE